MTTASIEQITKTNTDTATKTGQTVEHIANGHAEALSKSSSAALTGFQELAKAYQALAAKNAEKLTASIKAIAAVKSPVEFVELHRKLVAEGVDAAVQDYGHIAKLTAAVFSATFEPMQKQVELLQNVAKR
jgi:hypothetical protein